MVHEGNAAKNEFEGAVVSPLSASKTTKTTIKVVDPNEHLYARTQPSGRKRYVVARRPVGSSKVVIVTLCDFSRGEAAARKAARKANLQMDQGINPNTEKKAKRAAERAEKLKAKHTFYSVGESYIARCKRHARSSVTIAEYTRILASDDLTPWHTRPIADISTEDVEKLIAKARARTKKGKMANALYTFLKGMMSHALTMRVLAVDPLAHFDREEHLTKERGRKRTLVHPYTGDAGELLAVYRGVDAIEPPHHPARALAKLLILTGLRVGTLAKVHDDDALRWSHVHDLGKPHQARIEIPWELRKTGEEGDDVQIVPLVPAAVAILESMAKVSDDAPVFTADGKTSMRIDTWIRDRYRKLADTAAGRKLLHWTIHDLRRSVGTGLGFIGCPHAVIDEILDHAGEAKAGIRGTYDLSERVEVRRQWMQKWADHLEAVA